MYSDTNDGYVCSKFAPDILHDEGIMDLLTLCAKRIEHMQVTALVYSRIIATLSHCCYIVS